MNLEKGMVENLKELEERTERLERWIKYNFPSYPL